MKLLFLLSIVKRSRISFGFVGEAVLFLRIWCNFTKKKLLEKLQQTDPITLRIWGTLQKAIFLPNLFLNCYAK